MRLTKHHGLGNDFLVLLDADGTRPLAAARVRALCDRHRGVGADGVIRATRPPAGDPGVVAVMELRNADGSRAEMSGNGIRCLAQALILGRWACGPTLPIRTDAGVRTVTVDAEVDAVTQLSAVAMGTARIVGDAPEWSGGPVRRALLVEVGNPHLVLELSPGHEAAAVGDTGEVQLVDIGERANTELREGANVHLLARNAAQPLAPSWSAGVPGPVAGAPADGDGAGGGGGGGGIVIRTYERGVGPTQACGTGACASAAAARRWGLAGDRVAVRQPGGSAEVMLGLVIVLRGPATLVAAVDVPDVLDVGGRLAGEAVAAVADPGGVAG